MSVRSVVRSCAGIVAAALVAAALVTVTSQPASAAPPSCFGVTQILAERPNGTLDYYEHDAPETGDPNAWLDPEPAGSGWYGRVFDSDYDVYNITPSGDLRYYDYGGGGTWHTDEGTPLTGKTIGTGWGAYLSGPDRGLISTGGNGLYVVRGDDLVEYQARSGSITPSGTVVATGWQNYTMISATSDAVFAVDHAGNLYRYPYNAETDTFPTTPQLIGSGWGQYTQLLTPGEDIIYAINGSTGVMNWYHFNGDTRTWDNNGVGRVVGTGWYASTFSDVAMQLGSCAGVEPVGWQPNPYVMCQANSRVFDARPDGSLWLYEDTSPDNPLTVGWTNVRQIGSGFTGRTFASDASYVYNITPDGELRLYHYGQNSWAGLGQTIGTGWGYWASGAGQSKITVDSTGTIYAVDATGELLSYHYDEDRGGWTNTGTVIATGWTDRLIAVGDDGEFYQVDGQGNLYRSHYDASTGTWISLDTFISSGWQDLTSISSAGANTLYLVDGTTGDLDWYDLGAPTPPPDLRIGSGWYAAAHPQVSTTTDTCAEPLPFTPPA